MKIIKKVLEIIFPNHCLSCEKIINRDGVFCEKCWSKLQFISEPKCQICSYPFEFQGLNLLCGKCLTKKPSFDKLITIFRYNHIIRKIVTSFKFRDQTFLAKKFAPLLFNKSRDEIMDCDFVISVPLHLKKLQQRKFNHSVLLAKTLLKLAPKKVFYSDFLIKTKNTKAQIELKKRDREKNLRSSFEVNKKYLTLLRGKKILLIDDVTTTGTTLESCAKILKKHGAKKVVALTIAKTAFTNS